MGMKQNSAGTWALDIRCYRDGMECRRRETFTGGRKEAEARVHEIKKTLRAKAENRSLTAFGSSTFGKVLDYYHDARKDRLVSPSAFKRMRRDLGGISIAEIGTRFKTYWLMLRRETSRQTGEPLAASTVNHYTVMGKAAFNMCVRDGLLDRNPLEHIELLKIVPRDVSLSEIDRLRLLNTIDRDASHLSAIVRFALAVPSRKAELVNLRRGDLDLFNMAVRVRHENAKGDAGSWKPIPPGWLTDYFRNLPPDIDGDPQAPLFFRRDRRGMAAPLGNFRAAWTRCLKEAKIGDWHFHDCRHAAASDLLNAGNPEQVVCQIAGWRSGNMIRQYYHKDGLAAARKVVFPGQKTSTSTGHLQAANA
jgi:integrase